MKTFATAVRPAPEARRSPLRGPRTGTPRRAERAKVHQALHGPHLQPKLTVGAPDDAYEREADRVADRVMRMSEPDGSLQRSCPKCEEELQTKPVGKLEDEEELRRKRGTGSGGVPEVEGNLETRIRALRGGGRPLLERARSFFEPRFGYDLGAVRIHHAGPRAADLARSVDARAFTVGREVVVGADEPRPETRRGRKLLAHELTHVVQQRTDSQSRIQRDLLSYQNEDVELLPSMGALVGVPPPPLYRRIEGSAPAIQAALGALISAGNVSVRREGNEISFSTTAGFRSQAESAFGAAGFARSSEMADALVALNDTFLYTGERLIQQSLLFGLWEQTLSRRTDLIQREQRRPLTSFERSEARAVFGSSLDLDRFELVEESVPVLSILGDAVSIPGAVYFPSGSFSGSGFMRWLIHELTHQWQYQHGYSVATTAVYAVQGNYDYGGEQGLIEAQNVGSTFRSFNTEQQGDILADFYVRTKRGQDVSAWLPFVLQARNP